MQVRRGGPHDDRLQRAGDDFQADAVHVEKSVDLDHLPFAAIVPRHGRTVSHQHHAAAGEIFGRQRACVDTPAVEYEQATAALPLLMHQPQHARGAVAITELPLLRPHRIERETADAEHPPDVHDGFRLGEREIEQFSIAGHRFDRQAAIERRGSQAGLDRLPLRLRHAAQGQRLERPAA